MPRNGVGSYSLPAGNPVVSGTTIDESWANGTMPDIGAEITNSIARDGQSPPTADIPMGSFKLTGVADPTTAQDAATKIYVDGATPLVASTSRTINGLQPVLSLAQSALQVASIANTAEQTMATITVPANSMGANGSVVIQSLAFQFILGGTGTSTIRVKFGGTTIYNVNTSFTTGTGMMAIPLLIIQNSVATNVQFIHNSALTGTAGSYIYTTIDTTAAQNLIFTVQKAAGADVALLDGYTVNIVPKS